MFEVVLPYYFKKFQPNFKFVITEKVPNLSTFQNYAFGSHFKSEYCLFSVENEQKTHYQELKYFLYFHLLQILSFSC